MYEDYEFKVVRNTLHTRMIELEDINNGDYNGAVPLTDEEMVKILMRMKIQIQEKTLMQK